MLNKIYIPFLPSLYLSARPRSSYLSFTFSFDGVAAAAVYPHAFGPTTGRGRKPEALCSVQGPSDQPEKFLFAEHSLPRDIASPEIELPRPQYSE